MSEVEKQIMNRIAGNADLKARRISLTRTSMK